MKRIGFWGILTAVALAFAFSWSVTAAREDGISNLRYVAGETAGGDTAIYLQRVGDADWLFLPASADVDALVLFFDGTEAAELSGNLGSAALQSGEAVSLPALALPDAGGAYALTLRAGGQALPFRVLRSEHLRSLFLTSADPETRGRDWVELDKSNRAKGGAVLLRPDGSVVYDGALKQIKGRGNATWDAPKKPYQIKLAEDADLLETGDAAEAERTWVLLANYYDSTLIHNILTYDLATAFGVPYSPHSAQVDLYYDGEYRGAYQLCEKTEVGDGRVDIDDLEARIEDANPAVDDFDALARVLGTDGRMEYQSVEGIALPESHTGGYLLEMDYENRALEEASWFRTGNGAYVVCKSPEYLPAEGVEYIACIFQHFEDAIWNGGTDPDTGKDYTEFVDLDSLARWYLLEELSADSDAFSSSSYFYKPAGEEKLYAGPVWDFDSCYENNSWFGPDYVAARRTYGRKLLEIPSFRAKLLELYQDSLSGLLYRTVLNVSPTVQDGALRSIAGYGAEIAASRRMNDLLWPECAGEAGADAVAVLREYVSLRGAWLFTELRKQEPSFDRFLDVTPDAWYYGAVTGAMDRGLFPAEISFLPLGSVPREEFIAALYRLNGSPRVETAPAYSDAVPGAWYDAALAWAAETGIARGYDDGCFGVGVPVNREEMAVMLHRCAALLGFDTGASADLSHFPDAASVSAYAIGALRWAVGSALLDGTGEGTLSPLDWATRAQVAVVLTRFGKLFGL